MRAPNKHSLGDDDDNGGDDGRIGFDGSDADRVRLLQPRCGIVGVFVGVGGRGVDGGELIPGVIKRRVEFHGFL